MQPKRWALISVTDKTNLATFAKALQNVGYSLLSTGKTASEIRRAGLEVTELSDYTGFPECFEGRLKTLHPKIFGGILHRDLQEDLEICRNLQIESIDIVCVNLYPFENTIESAPDDLKQALEMIDIGGPSLIRAAAKNYRRTLVVTSVADYDTVISKLQAGENTESFRFQMAVKAFQTTSAYDAAISNYLTERSEDTEFPSQVRLALQKREDLRYGENPHQRASLYTVTTPKEVPQPFEQLQGKPLSFNNHLDMHAAVCLMADLEIYEKPAAAIIKHTNPCGVALSPSVQEAFQRALSTDPMSAFGGIVVLNRPVDAPLATKLTETFFEIIVAPEIETDACSIFRQKKNLRVCRIPLKRPNIRWDIKRLLWGYLIQTPDTETDTPSEWNVVTERRPSAEEEAQLAFAWTLVKHVKSNAIVITRDFQALGIGAGQMSRIDACRLAIQKWGKPLDGAVVASDAFFPFKDNIEEVARAGVRAIIQPGGSLRDQESIDAANAYKIAMIFTGRRHFRH